MLDLGDVLAGQADRASGDVLQPDQRFGELGLAVALDPGEA